MLLNVSEGAVYEETNDALDQSGREAVIIVLVGSLMISDTVIILWNGS